MMAHKPPVIVPVTFFRSFFLYRPRFDTVTLENVITAGVLSGTVGV